MDLETFRNKYEKVPVNEYRFYERPLPLVSVCVQTYQHAPYIQACLDGILAQQTNFVYEILLGEDNSHDSTREICIAYADRYPEKIRLFLHHRENNIHIARRPTGRFNFLNNLYRARGTYIAFCEGDDYWSDPFKLQKQVDFLESNLDFAMSCSNARYLNDADNSLKYELKDFKEPYEVYSIEDLLMGNFITTCTVLIKKPITLPNWFVELPIGDWPLYLFVCAANNGKIHRINSYTSTYRIHGGGVFSLSLKSSQVKRMMDTCSIILAKSDFLSNKQISFLKKLEASYHIQYLSTIHNKTISRADRFWGLVGCIIRVKYYSWSDLKYISVFLIDLLSNRK
jgi:glycosyltransferase involved in cell wall biosynthesis